MAKNILFLLLLCSFSMTTFAQDKQSSIILKDVKAAPNPFKNSTQITFLTNEILEVDFYVKNLLGNIVTYKNLKTKTGTNTIHFYRNQLQPGIYIYSLKSKSKVISKRIVIK